VVTKAAFFGHLPDSGLTSPLFFKGFSLSALAILAPVAHDMRRVDALILERLHSDVALIRQIGHYIVQSGGKRLRPALVLLSAQSLGYEGVAHHELAVVVEFIHTATLLHDDVVDESGLRRGKATANALFGNAASVLVGDFLYSRAFQMMVGVESMPVMKTLADATNVIAEGEVLQLLNCGNPDIRVEAYLQVIRYKTAKLFEAAMRLGAILANAPEPVQADMARYGMHLGTAFQIIDDVLDYSATESDIGKHLGDDLAEGKPTLPLIHVMQQGTPEQAAQVRKAIEEGGREAFPDVLAAIKATNALDAAKAQAQSEAQAARICLEGLPSSMAKNSLLELCAFAVDRNF
jgi:octaprenyl-diphosphate synthase